jgi:hypothetical protein
MIGDLTIAYAETIGTMWDAEEPTYSDGIDVSAVNYFLYEIMLIKQIENDRPEVYDNGGE